MLIGGQATQITLDGIPLWGDMIGFLPREAVEGLGSVQSEGTAKQSGPQSGSEAEDPGSQSSQQSAQASQSQQPQGGVEAASAVGGLIIRAAIVGGRAVWSLGRWLAKRWVARRAAQQAAKRAFSRVIQEFERDTSKFQKIGERVEAATRRDVRGTGQSIQEIFRHKETGQTILRHTVKDARGKIVHRDYRDYVK